MNIVVDTRYLVPGQPYSASFFTYDQLAELAAAQPSHRFIFIRTNKAAPLPGLPANAMELSAGPGTANKLCCNTGTTTNCRSCCANKEQTYFWQPKASVRCVPGFLNACLYMTRRLLTPPLYSPGCIFVFTGNIRAASWQRLKP
ncbi:MAG TPA: hypothetical protein PLT49_05830 [Ferruginibacter sp.]|nr:hypothetical protein [Ferruginibacter sp.]